MYGVLGEDDSDARSIKTLLKKLTCNECLTIKTKGFGGKAKLLKQGARVLEAWKSLGVRRFFIAVDSDGNDPDEVRRIIMNRVVEPAEIISESCCVVPVQEFEAWILADVEAVSNVIPSWRPNPISNPESIIDPKEYLERLSKAENKKPRYSYATHNEHVVKHVNTQTLYAKCGSFRFFADFVSKYC